MLRTVHRAGRGAALLCALAGLPASANAQNDAKPAGTMMRFPDVSATQVVFVYANDLWVAPRSGGLASPLASPPGSESFPRFSPDGSSIAFVGNYDSTRDIYTVPVSGGLPQRVASYPGGEVLTDWAPDGRLIFYSNAWAGLPRQTQIFTVPPSGGMPTRLPVPYGANGAVSPDAQWLAYTPHTADNRTWKRYRGGMATDIWLFNLNDNSARKITDWEGTDSIPMWHGSDLYYLSDDGPEHRLNIWKYDTASGNRSRLTSFKDFDVKWPSIGPGPAGKGEIVFQLGSALHLLDLATSKVTRLDITIPGARATLRKRDVDAAPNITSASISPSGKRVALEARGEIFNAPAKEGATWNMTRTDGVAERSPAWSPDAKWIAYFSDASGEYDLWVMPADAKSAPRKVADLGPGFRSALAWSPDSKMVTFNDQAGRLRLATIETGEVKLIDTDPWANQAWVNWSQDSAWIAYERTDDASAQAAIWLYNVASGEKTRVTDPFFNSSTPVFDRKGEWLFFRSSRSFGSPIYADLDTTWVYAATEQILAIPLRKDVKSPYLVKNDNEEPKKDADKADKDKKDSDEKKDEPKPAADAAPDDAVSGTWEGKASGGNLPPDGIPFSLTITLGDDGVVTGSISSVMGSGAVTGSYDKSTGSVTLSVALGGPAATLTGTISADKISGQWTVEGQTGQWEASRTAGPSASQPQDADKKDDKKDEKKDEKPKEVKIDLDGLEARAIVLPIPAGNFGPMAVSHDNKLLYSRQAPRSGGEGGIKIFDLADDEKKEQAVTALGGWELSADGKKLLVIRGASASVMDPAPGGGKATNVPTSGLTMTIDPRAEWRQIFTDAWRIQRDFFYEPTMHGVDWPAVRDAYAALLDDCANREDVNVLIAEMISELNVGHAYLTGPGDIEQPSLAGPGLLGCDFALESSDGASAYRITKIYSGAPWDSDARGPLSQPGVDAKPGDFLLAVNGTPVDITRDPYAAFRGTSGKTVRLTLSDKPVLDDSAREVFVQTIASEVTLRYRDWIERNRKYVAEKTGGKVGYIYVPNTGVDGQNDLYRQFLGQRAMEGLIIDERWNGGGQIPTRFIEMLTRPVVNYWARRDGNDWPWPPDSAPGPKCMLINGLAGSGGDMFPALFKQMGVGKVIGMRTWGGLVGISGNPGLIDGGAVSVPTFGYYQTDGTWGIEGHGVDPDIVVIDDPSKMLNGADPQLDAAIDHMLAEIQARPYRKPQRPASPDRSGMGIREEDK